MATQIHELERLFKALGDATRLRILGLLSAGEVCVCDIHETLGIPQPKASRHLAYLRKAGLVDVRREGLWMHYRLADRTAPVVHAITAAVAHALTHVDVVKRDGARLQKATGCCSPVQRIDSVALPCCEQKPGRSRRSAAIATIGGVGR
ncbi:MAG TPA: metalloregulator ArsR/SmtB family transcription factor [Vicinamibacterales bacterium]|nr:metalloregulator ArsR/SmtB family transcription factor [Vicinamibacterales bacterium]